MTEEQNDYIKTVSETIRREVCADDRLSSLPDSEFEIYIWKRLKEDKYCREWTIEEKIEASGRIFSGMRGLDVLDGIMSDRSVTEIMVNGPDCIFAEREGRVFRLAAAFESEKKLEDVIQRIVGPAGREVNRANPIVDTRLPDGSRVSVVLPPVSLNGPQMTIRRFPEKAMTFPRLIELGTVTEQIANSLRLLVRAGYNIFISGGTGSGKTSFLNALSDFIPPDERIVTIEDSAELKLSRLENVVRLETRNPNSAGVGGIGIRTLIRASLRMRPERIIVGEVRGPEALDMLQAMNTGHDGSISTGHANSSADMLTRLETMVLEASPGLPLAAIRSAIASAIDVIVHLSRMRDGSRRMIEMSEVDGVEDGKIKLNVLYRYVGDENGEEGEGRFERLPNPLHSTLKLERKGIKERF